MESPCYIGSEIKFVFGVFFYRFGVRGRIYSRHDVKAIQVGSEGLLFTGDAAGLVSVWKPNGESVSKSQ
ncbi:hypothetical protein HanLR1_Chr17g0686821 [Helianthus annuus]|nr:hypothetical protein HanLR1_Chr17g0686821 [Helianthus annuus]